MLFYSKNKFVFLKKLKKNWFFLNIFTLPNFPTKNKWFNFSSESIQYKSTKIETLFHVIVINVFCIYWKFRACDATRIFFLLTLLVIIFALEIFNLSIKFQTLYPQSWDWLKRINLVNINKMIDTICRFKICF